jgi:DNA-binding response OmpR family regulator
MATILIIEDDDIMLKAIRNILTKSGYIVITAKDGKEAFEQLDNSEYDIVITDLMMPYANGLEVVSRLRSDSTKRHVSIIVVSSVGNEETITEAFRLGADDYLKKPIMAGELLIRIKKLLDSRTNNNKLVTKKK